MSASKLSQKDYLKKYLSGGDDKKKKKKKKPKGSVSGIGIKVKVIDDDIDLSKLQPIDDSALDLYEVNEDAPQIAGIVDERPAELQALDQYKQSQRWKVLSNPDGDGVNVSMSGTSKSIENVTLSAEEDEELNVRPSSGIHSGKSSSTAKSGKQKRHFKQEYCSDESPPRKGRQYDSDVSPPRKRQQYDSDESPPRKGQKDDSDVSPPRKGPQYDSDVSPPRKTRHYDSDVSPPRKGRKDDSDVSPPRKHRQDNSDIQRKKHHQNDSEANARRSKRHDDSDVSPPRRRQKGDSDVSPTRRKRDDDSDVTPPRRRKQHDSNESHSKRRHLDNTDSSPPRRKSHASQRQHGNLDTSPLRGRTIKRERDSNERTVGKDVKREKESKMKSTLDGKVAGLQDAKKLKQEMLEVRQREKEAFDKMDDSISGRGAAPVKRDRQTGMKRDMDREQAEQRVKDEKENKKKEKYTRWGKGLKQTEAQQERLERDLYEMSKPLARYADDADLETHLREQEREGDPMLEYLRSKKKEEAKSTVPIYQGAFPPNRYNIRPGYRWDGVDRSSGYEKKRFESLNAKKATEEDAYKWSTSDM